MLNLVLAATKENPLVNGSPFYVITNFSEYYKNHNLFLITADTFGICFMILFFKNKIDFISVNSRVFAVDIKKKSVIKFGLAKPYKSHPYVFLTGKPGCRRTFLVSFFDTIINPQTNHPSQNCFTHD